MKRKWIITVGLISIGNLCPRAAFADGIDLVAYFSRTPYENIVLAIPIVALLMLVNYCLNLIVIGLPIRRLGPLPFKRISRSLIWLTLFGQLADRFGAILAGLMAGIAVGVLGLEGEGSWVMPLLAMNFVFAGISVGILAFVFAKRNWELSFKHSFWIAVGAGILTNPAWAMGLWFFNV